MRIAIVGAGISGLVGGYYLRHQHDVTVFESNDRIGGHTNTIDCQEDEQTLAVDTGFIVYNERTYPNFIRLMDELSVATQPTRMSFSPMAPSTESSRWKCLSTCETTSCCYSASPTGSIRVENSSFIFSVIVTSRTNSTMTQKPIG